MIGSYQSSQFDRDARVLPNYGGGTGGGGGEVIGWGDAIGAMENRTRGAGGVGIPPPVYEEGREGRGGARRGRDEKRGGAGGR